MRLMKKPGNIRIVLKSWLRLVSIPVLFLIAGMANEYAFNQTAPENSSYLPILGLELSFPAERSSVIHSSIHPSIHPYIQFNGRNDSEIRVVNSFKTSHYKNA